MDSNDDFWRSVSTSLFAGLTVLAAAAATGLVGGWGAVLFVLPVVLLLLAARAARASTAVTRPTFASAEQWSDAERRAVAAALARAGRRPDSAE